MTDVQLPDAPKNNWDKGERPEARDSERRSVGEHATTRLRTSSARFLRS